MEKKQIKISLSTFLLIIAIVIIAVMGYFIYNMSIEKTKSQQQISELEVNKKSLETQVNTILEKTNDIETNNVDDNTVSSKSSTNISYDSEGIIEIGYDSIVSLVNGKPYIIPISRDTLMSDLSDKLKSTFYYLKHEVDNINSGVTKIVKANLGLDVSETTYFVMEDGSVRKLVMEDTKFTSEEVVKASANIVDLVFEDGILYSINKSGEKTKIAESMDR